MLVGPLQLLLQVLLRQQEPQYLPFAAIVCVTATVATVLASAAVAAARLAGDCSCNGCVGVTPVYKFDGRLSLQRGSMDDIAATKTGLQQTLKENIFGNSDLGGSRIEWPRNSISRRVKKLSWEDENADRDISTLTTNPNFSVGIKRIDDEVPVA